MHTNKLFGIKYNWLQNNSVQNLSQLFFGWIYSVDSSSSNKDDLLFWRIYDSPESLIWACILYCSNDPLISYFFLFAFWFLGFELYFNRWTVLPFFSITYFIIISVHKFTYSNKMAVETTRSSICRWSKSCAICRLYVLCHISIDRRGWWFVPCNQGTRYWRCSSNKLCQAFYSQNIRRVKMSEQFCHP